mmetsp:Transcript_16098/g.51569  ORF Transcript_16098/g.51569 Transcript_16098/m.51569 type:complete len:134 (+) Transcript_16098:815-1216(+)
MREAPWQSSSSCALSGFGPSGLGLDVTHTILQRSETVDWVRNVLCIAFLVEGALQRSLERFAVPFLCAGGGFEQQLKEHEYSRRFRTPVDIEKAALDLHDHLEVQAVSKLSLHWALAGEIAPMNVKVPLWSIS